LRIKLKKKMGLIVDERGTVIDKLESVQTESLNDRLMNKQGAEQKKEQKNYTPISDYKPTGNFVYDKEFFDKIEKRIS